MKGDNPPMQKYTLTVFYGPHKTATAETTDPQEAQRASDALHAQADFTIGGKRIQGAGVTSTAIYPPVR